MKAKETIGEGIRNLTSRHTKPALTLLIFLLCIGGPLAIDHISIRNILSEQQRFLESGASVFFYEESANVSGHFCENLNTIPGIASAGALRQVEDLTLDVMPDIPVSTFAATPGALTTITGATPSVLDGVFLPQALATQINAQVGDTLSVTGGEVPVAGVYPSPEDGRDPLLSWAVLSPTPPQGTFDSCWIDVREQVSTNHLAALSASIAHNTDTPTSTATVRQLNTKHGVEFDAAQKLNDRLSKFTPALIAGALTTALYAFIWSRRVELSALLHLGMSRRALCVQLTIEYGVLLLAALSILALGLCASVAAPSLLDAAARAFMPVIPAAACGLICGVASTSGSKFYQYFRDRK